ncbi:hypothetical protein B7994_11985 [Fibrobacter sp. UWR2]|nr:hypothetical protein B7994_11985 [Fibrobacter sp. UWR2]
MAEQDDSFELEDFSEFEDLVELDVFSEFEDLTELDDFPELEDFDALWELEDSMTAISSLSVDSSSSRGIETTCEQPAKRRTLISHENKANLFIWRLLLPSRNLLRSIAFMAI